MKHPKPSRTARLLQTHQERRDRAREERVAMMDARRRDKGRCRFPHCGCDRVHGLRAAVEVSHERHRGMGGNPAGDRTRPELLITICKHRHQDGGISVHKGTLRIRHLTDRGCNGPVAWDADEFALSGYAPYRQAGSWFELARESAPGVLEPLTHLQAAVLAELARMED